MKTEDKFNPYRWIIGLDIDAEYPLHSQIKVSGVGTCTKAVSGNFCIGTLYSQPTKGFPGRAGIAVDGKYNHRGTGIAAEAITAGDRIKVGAPDGNGVQRYAKFVVGTDDPGIERGVALSSASQADDEFDGLFT